MWRMTKRGSIFVKSDHADKSRDHAYHGTTSHCEARYDRAIEMIMDQRFDRSTLRAMLFAPLTEADAARRQALRCSLRSWRSAGMSADSYKREEDRAILHILASRETFHSVRVILEGWIRWKAKRARISTSEHTVVGTCF